MRVVLQGLLERRLISQGYRASMSDPGAMSFTSSMLGPSRSAELQDQRRRSELKRSPSEMRVRLRDDAT